MWEFYDVTERHHQAFGIFHTLLEFLDDCVEFFDLRFQAFSQGRRYFSVLELFLCYRDADFVAGDVDKGSHLSIASHEEVLTSCIKPDGDNVVIEDSFDLGVFFACQTRKELNVRADRDSDNLS